MFNSKKCKRCESKIKDSFDFCPYCGLDLRNPEKDMEDFGMLGKGNFVNGSPLIGGGSFGLTDKMFNSLFNSLMRNFEKQMQNVNPSEVQNFPNGIKIRFGSLGGQPKNKKKSQKSIDTLNSLMKLLPNISKMHCKKSGSTM